MVKLFQVQFFEITQHCTLLFDVLVFLYPHSYYIGAKVHIVVADLDLLKEITVKESDKFIDPDVSKNLLLYY